MQNLSAVNAFLLFVKAFEYLALLPQLHFLFATLTVAPRDPNPSPNPNPNPNPNL